MRCLISGLLFTLVAVGCTGPSQGAQAPAGDQGPLRPSGPKRLTAAVLAQPVVIFGVTGPIPGVDTLQDLVHAGLVIRDNKNSLLPQLADAVPSVENGLWKVFPDGRMETTWRIRPGARWHDGAPFASEDLAFTVRVGQDRETPEFGHVAFALIEGVDASDPTTLVVRWKRPYIEADTMFTRTQAFPIARHLMERVHSENKTGFAEHLYWSEAFVGLGPYKLRSWVRGSHAELEAFDNHVLGRPKIDEIDVRFVSDHNTLVANILAGSIEVTLGRNISLEQALNLRDRWPDGRIELPDTDVWVTIYPQFLYTDPPIVRSLQLRRALLHAIDRQALVDSIQGGYGGVAHSILAPNQSPFRQIEGTIPRYDYNPARASQMIEELGYTRGSDGILRDASGQRLSFEVRTTGELDIHTKTFYPVLEYWQRVGVASDPVVIPPQRQRDPPYRATFPAFELLRGGNDVRALKNYHTSSQRTAESGWRGSYTGHSNPEYDSLYDRYAAAIPTSGRIQLIGQLVQYIADQLPVMGLFYDTEPALISKRLLNATGRGGQGSTNAWNAHEWDVS